MDDRELLYHSAHILLAQIGIAGVERIRDARVLVVGAGGLGTVVAPYLTRAGVRELILADGDTVTPSNLPRQMLYAATDTGRSKAAAAAEALDRCRPGEVHTQNMRLAGAALVEAVANADLVCDCSDNFETRFALNAACVQHAVPLVSAAVIRFEGQLLVVDPDMPEAGCYHCLYSEMAQAAEEERCAERGVFAPAVGVMGSLQAMEALKRLAGIEVPARRALILYDGLTQTMHTIGRRRDPECPVCGASRDAGAGAP